MKVLRRSKAVEILFVLSKGPKHVRELQSGVGGSASTLEARIQELQKEGLIRERKLDSWPFRKELELSEKGKEVVRIVELQGSLLSLAAPKPPEERMKWIFALLYAMGGEIRGRLRLQKLLFLLKHEYGAKLPYEFIPYMYGPYSADIFEDLAVLMDEGFLEVRGDSLEPREIVGDRTTGVNYSLTKRGEEKAGSIYAKLPNEVKRALSSLEKFNEMRIRELIRYVYDKYPYESLGMVRSGEDVKRKGPVIH